MWLAVYQGKRLAHYGRLYGSHIGFPSRHELYYIGGHLEQKVTDHTAHLPGKSLAHLRAYKAVTSNDR
jgi:hypothetical protein